jgi:hypothetical protein
MSKLTGKTVPTSEVKIAPRKRRGSKYQETLDAVSKLRRGQSWLVHVPQFVTPRTMINRLNAAMLRADLTPPTGCVYRKHTTVSGNVAICCEGK